MGIDWEWLYGEDAYEDLADKWSDDVADSLFYDEYANTTENDEYESIDELNDEYYIDDPLENYYLSKDGWIYSLHKYFNSNYFRCTIFEIGEEERKASSAIVMYKNGDADAILRFTDELYRAVMDIVSQFNIENLPVWLIGVPPSKVWKMPQVSLSIKKIVHRYGLEQTREYDLSDMSAVLDRNVDMYSAHQSEIRPDIEEYLNTISVIPFVPADVFIVLLDDVVTKGTTLNACRQLLVQSGATENNIFGLTVGRNVDSNMIKGYLRKKDN